MSTSFRIHSSIDSARSSSSPARPSDHPPAVRHSVVGATVIAALLLASCAGGGNSNETPSAQAQQPVTIQFAAKAGAAAARCGAPLGGLGTGATASELSDLRFYVSEARLMTEQDTDVPITLTVNDWQNDKVSLIDLEDGTGACAVSGTPGTNNVITGTVPPGKYTGVKFTVGVPSSMNHSDFAVATRPLDVQALAWSWQSGRKFAKIEVDPSGGVARPAPANPSKTFYFHLGSTGCTGNPVTGEAITCARPNRMDYHSHAFNAQTDQVVVDLAALFAKSDLTTDGGSAPGCMSGADDPECAPIFAAMKIDLASGQPIDQGHGQTLFKVEPK